MSLPSEIVEKIQSFVESCQKFEAQREQESTVVRENYDRSLDETLKKLQDQIDKQEATLQELRVNRPLVLLPPNLDPATRLAQTRRAIAAYRSLSNKEPELPASGSPLSGLLALREAIRVIQELKVSIAATAQDLVTNRERLNTEEANLHDARLITVELRKRVENLQNQQQQEAGQKKKPSQIAKELIQQERRRAAHLETGTAELKDALRSFIDERLAPMLAAEDLGGPVVGDQIDIPDSTLEAGYTAHGKVKKSRMNGQNSRDSKQSRIDDFVRRPNSDEDPSSMTSGTRDAAATDLHDLIGRLLDDAPSSSYIELEKDSAASRFLVKAKIAQFHPRDSRKMRLINVARDISD
ncbi:hypothetical protein PRK78_003495 [Emydomyces testavorans]|uniref:Uncharacterized protein n=1 Tax=Emydomyces testavorans TaxID=2070801 RepID=A0AAF0DGX8_9EURO|nr:hypothetical protein PRK78_003495 [Emydomyces testavorans]